jgi:hypothetical protein
MKLKLLIIFLIAALLLPQASSVHASPAPDARQMGAEIIARAKIWVDKNVPYNQAGYLNGYRTDCSGFASYAWQVKTTKGEPANVDGINLANTYGVKIDFSALQPGDIIDNMRPGNSGHVVIFVNWIIKGTRFLAYEELGYKGKAISSTLNLVSHKTNGVLDGTTIQEYDPYAPGPFYAYRYKNMAGFADVVDGVRLSNTSPRSGENVTAWFQVRNDGGQSLIISQLTASVRGPGGRLQGWNAPNADFPVVKNITLKPGESYQYVQARSFYATGEYFVEPTKDQAGWGGIFPYPRLYFTVKS